MKNIILLVIAACSFTGLYAQKISGEKVPAAVLNTFKTKFPTAAGAKWEMENTTEYEVNFKSDGEDHSATFDKNGNWLETETEIEISSLPKVVSNAIGSLYNGYQVKEAEKLDTPDKGMLYEVELKKGNEILEVQVSADGKVLNSKKEGKD